MVLRLPFLVKLEFENVSLWGEGKTRVPREKPLRARENSTHIISTLGFEPGPYWSETSALTPALLCSRTCMNMRKTKKKTFIKKFKQQQCAHLCLISQIIIFFWCWLFSSIDVFSERCYSSIPCCDHLVSSSSCSNASHFVLFIGRKSFSLVVFRNQEWRRWWFYKS